MSFYGSSFIFNGIQSEIYDLRLFEFEPSNPSDAPAGGEVSIKEEWLYRRETPYFYGRYYETPLEFDFTVGSFNYIDGASRHAIQTWLLGRPTYLPLRIVQDDISDIIFNVILTQSSHVYVGNLSYALNLHARCDRPFGIYYPPTLTKTYADGGMSDNFSYLNSSVYAGYNRPIITFTTSSASANRFSIINTSDSNREFLFDGLSDTETITVDNDKGIISSSSGSSVLRLDKFNKKFFRLVQGNNDLVLNGGITEFTLTTTFSKGIGG